MRSRTHFRPSRLRAAGSAALVAALTMSVLAGCSDDEPPVEDPPASATPTAPTDSADDPTDESDPTEPAGPTPASGTLVEQNALHLHLTEGTWITDRTGSAVVAANTDADGTFNVALADLATTNTDLEVQANAARQGRELERPSLKRVANRTINGVECWAMTGRNKDWFKYSVGGLHNGYQFSIDFQFSAENPDAEELIESILASIEWQ